MSNPLCNTNIIGTRPGTIFVVTPAVQYVNATQPLFIADAIPSVQKIQAISPIVQDANKMTVPYKIISNLAPTDPRIQQNSTRVGIIQQDNIIQYNTHNTKSVSYKIINNMYDSLYNTSATTSIRFAKTIITTVQRI